MRAAHKLVAGAALAALLVASSGCPFLFPPQQTGDGPIAEGIMAPLGEPLPSATTEQLAAFDRGKDIFLKRFDLSDGLGPEFNVTFCGGCHEKPVFGGAAGLYRNFFLAGKTTIDGAFVFSRTGGQDKGGVLDFFNYDESGGETARPSVPEDTSIFAQRNPIPFFGMGLLAEISEEEILSRADVDDSDGDGISGKPNFDRGFVGRFGRKSQTVSLEGFIRGPLFNHLGITTVPLTDEMRSRLPVDSSVESALSKVVQTGQVRREIKNGPHMQAAAPDGPNFDDDGVADPEMTIDQLFDLVTFQMLMAAPQLEELGVQGERGRQLFHDAGCADCHVPRLNGPRGPIPAYSDLLLHDMGPGLADGIVMMEAGGSEFRTQPLWGIIAAAPYLHDGRAATLEEAILWHGGEAQAARDVYAAYSEDQRADLLEFLASLGGRDQASAGLLAPSTPIPADGAYAGPFRDLTSEEEDRFVNGRAVFDRDFMFSTGAGGLTGTMDDGRFNGDSCRACHFDPVIGGAGPRGVNVMRHGVANAPEDFADPMTTANTILHKQVRIGNPIITPEAGTNVFEMRQTPHLFGLGFVESISDETIMANADPEDSDGDGISGRAHVLPGDGRIGRLGWKADVPSVSEFVRDAMAAEIGITLPEQPGLTFGITSDMDGIPDPELSLRDAEDLAFFMRVLAPPPRQMDGLDADDVVAGEQLFAGIGCAKCHIPSMPSALGPAELYSDLLLHDILPAGSAGIVSGDASQTEFRTAPLWGLSQTAPYFHDGAADTIDEAIRMHAGEAQAAKEAYESSLSDAGRRQLLAFLSSL